MSDVTPGTSTTAPPTVADFERVLALADTDLPQARVEIARLCLLHLRQPALENLHGVILSRIGAYEEAIGAFRRALEIEERFADARNNLAATLSKINRDEEAAECYEQLLSVNQKDPEIFYNYGNSLVKLGRSVDAIGAYTHAMRLSPRFAAACNNLGNVLSKLGQLAQAKKCYERVLVIEPDHNAASRNLALLHAVGNQLAAAEMLYERLLQRNPGDVDVLLDVANFHIYQKKPKAAIKCLEKLLRITPTAAVPLFLLDALRGKSPDSAPKDYARGLFDAYADRFDHDLTVNLGYQNPVQLRRLLAEAVAVPRHYRNTLDIGCGTGLAGEAFHAITSRLSGIDLSTAMLAKAQQKGRYHSLLAGDATELLLQSDEVFDLVLCADALPYIGDLMPLFVAVAAHTEPGGHFLCSTELARSGRYTVQTTARYAHSAGYVIESASGAGFELLAQEAVPLRKERDAWLIGGIYCFVRRA